MLESDVFIRPLDPTVKHHWSLELFQRDPLQGSVDHQDLFRRLPCPGGNVLISVGAGDRSATAATTSGKEITGGSESQFAKILQYWLVVRCEADKAISVHGVLE